MSEPRPDSVSYTHLTFMEEYGVIVVAAIVIMIIVVAATPLGNSIKLGITAEVEKLTPALGTTASVVG